jgi:hypothetical protein
VVRVTTPLRSRPRTVHAYLLETSGGPVLVDGGADTGEAWEVLDGAVRACIGRWSDLKLQLVTHMHVDHIGLARRIRQASWYASGPVRTGTEGGWTACGCGFPVRKPGFRDSGTAGLVRIVGNVCPRPEKVSGSGDVDDPAEPDVRRLPEVTMRKWALLLLFVLIGAVANPTMRAAADPYARPYIERVLSPVYEYSVGVRVKDMARRLQEANARGDEMPTSEQFSLFVARHYSGPDADLDPWGVAYYLRGDNVRYRVVSAGPDRTSDTGDDLYSPFVTLKP